MSSVNPLAGLFQELGEKIWADFGLEKREEAERVEMLRRLTGMVLQGALVQAADLLDDDEVSHVEQMMGDSSVSEGDRSMNAMSYVADHVPDLGRLIDEAYEEVKAVAVKVTEEQREKKFEPAEQTVEAASDLIDMVQDGIEDAGAEVPGLSIFGIAFDLFVDPARFLRSAHERQERFVRHANSLLLKAAVAAWTGLLTFTAIDAWQRWRGGSPLPKLVREMVPDWYERQGLLNQMLLLLAIAIGMFLVLVVLAFLLKLVGMSDRFTPIFELRVRDDELVSNVLRPRLRDILGIGFFENSVWRSAALVYCDMYRQWPRANSDTLKVLEEILESRDEKAAAALLKSKLHSRYRSAMKDVVDRHCEELKNFMGSIH